MIWNIGRLPWNHDITFTLYVWIGHRNAISLEKQNLPRKVWRSRGFIPWFHDFQEEPNTNSVLNFWAFSCWSLITDIPKKFWIIIYRSSSSCNHSSHLSQILNDAHPRFKEAVSKYALMYYLNLPLSNLVCRMWWSWEQPKYHPIQTLSQLPQRRETATLTMNSHWRAIRSILK